MEDIFFFFFYRLRNSFIGSWDERLVFQVFQMSTMLPFLNSVEKCFTWLQQPKILQQTSSNKRTKPILYAGKFFNLWKELNKDTKEVSIYEFKDDIIGVLKFYNDSYLKKSFGKGIVILKNSGLMLIVISNKSAETIYIYEPKSWTLLDNKTIKFSRRPRRISIIYNNNNGTIKMNEYQFVDIKKSLLERYIDMLYDKNDILMLQNLFEKDILHLLYLNVIYYYWFLY